RHRHHGRSPPTRRCGRQSLLASRGGSRERGIRTDTLRLGYRTGPHELPAVASPTVGPAELALLPHDERTVLLTRHLSAGRGEALAARGWESYPDASGPRTPRDSPGAGALRRDLDHRRHPSGGGSGTGAPPAGGRTAPGTPPPPTPWEATPTVGGDTPGGGDTA